MKNGLNGLKINIIMLEDLKIMKVKQEFVILQCFYLWPDDSSKEIYCILKTTTVTEIIGNREFKTLNSIYRIITLEDERDERIKIILE